MYLKNKRPIKAAEERALWEEYQRTNDPKIRERFIMSVYVLACCEAYKFNNTTVPKEDLIQAAMAGVTYAFDKKFKPEMGVRFATYAIYYIKKELLKLVRDERTIVSHTGLSAGRADQNGRREVNVIYVDDPMVVGMGHTGTAASDASYDSSTALDRCAHTPSFLDIVDSDDRSERIRTLVTSTQLSDVERWVLNRRWLDRPLKKPTFHELAAERGCSTQRIWTAEKRAFEKIRRQAKRRGIHG